MEKRVLKGRYLKEKTLFPTNLHDIRNGLVCDLPMDELSGDVVYDQSGNGNNGTITGGERCQGMGDSKALCLDGANNKVLIADDISINPDVFSLCFFVKKVEEPDNYERIIAKYKFDVSSIGFQVLFGNTDPRKVFMQLYDESGSSLSTFSYNTTIGIDEWRFYFFVYASDKKIYAYENGEFVGSTGALAGTFNKSDTDLFLATTGTSPAPPIVFDSFRMYNREVSAKEIKNLYLYLKKKAGLI